MVHLEIKVIVIVGLISMFFIACSSSVPSESDGRKVLENIARNKGDYTVTRFAKTNAMEDKVGGRYSLEFEADLQCHRVTNVPFGGYLTVSEWNIVCSEVGENKKLNSTLVFEKTEKGWRGMDGQIY